MTTVRPTWDEYFLNIAEAVSKRSSCTRRQVGAVLVDQSHHIISTGYNGSPSGTAHCIDGACPRGKLSYEEQPAFKDYGNCIAVHAEVNALTQAMVDGWLPYLEYSTIYITCQPCEDCARRLACIGRVVYPGSQD